METGFGERPQELYSATQIARYDTELWASRWMFCPNCGNSNLSQFRANRPVADFYCSACGDQYELKSQQKKFGRKIANGAFSTKIERLKSDTSPNLILLQYNRAERVVENLTVVPKQFFVQSIVEERKPLKPPAKRAGWVGSNIILERIPDSGMITVVRNRVVLNRKSILEEWHKTRFVAHKVAVARGWLVDVMRCVENIGKTEFDLTDIYACEGYLAELYPNNSNIRPKIRQQLQVLRDNGYLMFLGDGRYRRLV